MMLKNCKHIARLALAVQLVADPVTVSALVKPLAPLAMEFMLMESVFREQALMPNLVGIQTQGASASRQSGRAIQDLRSRLAVIAQVIWYSIGEFGWSTTGSLQNPGKPTPLHSLDTLLRSNRTEFQLIIVTYTDQNQSDRGWTRVQNILMGRHGSFIDYEDRRDISVSNAVTHAYGRSNRTDVILLRGVDARLPGDPVKFAKDPLGSLLTIEQKARAQVDCPVVLWVSRSFYHLIRLQADQKKRYPARAIPVIDLEEGLQEDMIPASAGDERAAPAPNAAIGTKPKSGRTGDLSEVELGIFHNESADELMKRGVSRDTAIMIHQARNDGTGVFTGLENLRNRIIPYGFWNRHNAGASVDKIIRAARQKIEISLGMAPPVPEAATSSDAQPLVRDLRRAG